MYVFLIFAVFSLFNLSLVFCSQGYKDSKGIKTPTKQVTQDIERLGVTEKIAEEKQSPSQTTSLNDYMVDPKDGVYGKGL